MPVVFLSGSSNGQKYRAVSEVLTRPQRRIIAAVMSSIDSEGFVIAGGAALLIAGVSDRPTRDLDAFSASCADVAAVAHRLVEDLADDGYIAEFERGNESFAKLAVTTGKWRRTSLQIDLGRDAQLLESVPSALGPMLSIRELAANKVLAAFGRHEPRDVADLKTLARVAPLQQAFADAKTKDRGFSLEIFHEMVSRTIEVRDDLWPVGVNPDALREFVRAELLATINPPPTIDPPTANDSLDPD